METRMKSKQKEEKPRNQRVGIFWYPPVTNIVIRFEISNLHEVRLRQEAFATAGRLHSVWNFHI